MNIVILYSSYLKENDLDRFGIKYFQNLGIEVKILNLTSLINKEYYSKSKKKINVSNEVFIHNFSQFEKELTNSCNKSHVIISFLHFNFKTYKFFEIISKYNFVYVKSLINIIPDLNFKKKKFIKRLLNLKLKNILFILKNYYFNYFKSKNIKINSPNYIILSGSYSLNHPQFKVANKQTKHIWAHSYDYDQFLNAEKNYIHKQKSDYAVFYDSPYPLFKNDIFIEGIENTLTVKNFYPTICNFFSHIENSLNVKIIIASHPASDHRNQDVYGGRDIIKNRTAELTKYCKFVILRNTTAICYPVLWNKPIIFYTSDELNKSKFMYNNLKNFTEFFSKEPLNINDNYEKIDFEKELNTDKNIYDSYIKYFIKYKKYNDDKLWKIFLDKINEYK